MGLIFVLGNLAAARWVLENNLMAFRGNRGNRVRAGDSFALYTTTRATGREGQVIAVGKVAGDLIREPLSVAGEEFAAHVPLHLIAQLPAGDGAPFSPLVPRLDFIRNKDRWSIHFFRTVVRVPESDFRLIQKWFLGCVTSRGGAVGD